MSILVMLNSCRRDDSIVFGPPLNFPIQDTISPVLTLSCGDTITHILNSSFNIPSATANDPQEGDLSALISISGNVNQNLAGTYFLRYFVMDSDSNLSDDTVYVIVANQAEFLGGVYGNIHDTCQVRSPFAYAATVNVSTTTNGAISINNFGAFGTAISVTAYVSGASINIPSQPLGAIGSLLSASGTINNFSQGEFYVSYMWTDGVTSEICISTYLR